MNKLNFSILIAFLFFSSHNLSGQNAKNPYDVVNIPQKLLLNANAVVRTDELTYSIESNTSSKVKIKQAITLLNENTSDFRMVRIPYNKSVNISGIKTTVYDSKGEAVYSEKTEKYDLSANFAELASDQRYWLISFPLRKYPFTIEYEYEKTLKESFFYEDWSFQPQSDVSVQHSGAQYIVSKGLGFRVKQLNLKHKCDTMILADKTIYTWQEENIAAYKLAEQIFISFDKKQPVLLTAPTIFNFGGFKGNMESWESFGKWLYDLNTNRDIVSSELQLKLKKLIENTTDKKEQVKIVYEYLQKNTRYESIQLGIGGYQTLEASFVEKKGFGDCKALSNYMKAMLKCIGINSYQVVVNAGTRDDIHDDFPSQQFNHVILCVPLVKDSVWLECTSQSQPFNFLGSFTDNRHVLLISENGGKLVKTPEYGPSANFRKTKMEVSIDFRGNARVNGLMIYSGISFENPLAKLKERDKIKEKWVNEIIESPNVTINQINYKEKVDTYPFVEINCDLQLHNFVSLTSKRMLFNPYLFSPVGFVPKSIDDEFSISYGQAFADSILITIPFGYSIAQLPKPEKLETKFGFCRYEYFNQGGRLIFIRQLKLNRGKYTKDDIEPFRKFANNIARLDRRLLVMEKN